MKQKVSPHVTTDIYIGRVQRAWGVLMSGQTIPSAPASRRKWILSGWLHRTLCVVDGLMGLCWYRINGMSGAAR